MTSLWEAEKGLPEPMFAVMTPAVLIVTRTRTLVPVLVEPTVACCWVKLGRYPAGIVPIAEVEVHEPEFF
jgi:hypothetical protein